MKLTIHDENIEESELLDWAHDVGSYHHISWIKEIALVVISWFKEEPYMSIQTSGSTGKPKLIRHSKDSMKASAQLTAKRFGLAPGMTTLNCLPTQYIAGKMMLIRALVLKLDQICIEPKLSLQTSYKNNIDFVAMTPMQLSATLEKNPQLILQIRTLILGGGPIMKKLNEIIQLLKTQCFATYGMTETITHIATRPVNGTHRTEKFEALENVHFDQKDNNLIIYAPHVQSNPLLTTDQVHLVDKKHFYWLGRSDNVINTGGLKVHPEQVEEKLQKQILKPYFVTAAPDDQSGDKVVLLVESEPYDEASLNELKKALDNLTKIERPKDIFFVKSFLRTKTGKIRRDIKLYRSMFNIRLK